jgi:alcohol dehydrogenase
VTVGGGSALDAAKGIALAATNPGPDTDLTWGVGGGRRAALPIICVPTTSGTGSEVNDYGVVTDELRHRKFYVGDPSCLASAVFLDPVLTLTLPAAPTAACGLDCLTHAVESFTSVRANPWADTLDLRVIETVRRWLPRAVADGSDLRARSAMLLAAHMAGQAMSTTGLGIVHAIGHPLGARHGIPHGTALALVLAPCLRFNEPVSRARLARIAGALGADDAGGSERRNAAAAIEAAQKLIHTVGAAGRLRDHGITREHLPAIADDTLVDPVLDNTPRRPTTADVQSILEEVL